MELKINTVILYFILLLYSFIGVYFDLYTTQIGLSMGFVELTIFGNRPELYYPFIFIMTSIIFILGTLFNIKFKEKYGDKFLILTVILIIMANVIPYMAGLHNLMVVLTV